MSFHSFSKPLLILSLLCTRTIACAGDIKMNGTQPWLARHSWVEHHPVHQKASVWISSQSTYLGCGLDL